MTHVLRLSLLTFIVSVFVWPQSYAAGQTGTLIDPFPGTRSIQPSRIQTFDNVPVPLPPAETPGFESVLDKNVDREGTLETGTSHTKNERAISRPRSLAPRSAPVTSLGTQRIVPVSFERPNLENAVSRVWDARKGDNLRDVLSIWSTREGYGLVWDTRYNYVLSVDFQTQRSYHDAVEALLEQFKKSQKQPKAVIHVDPQGYENYLVVRTKGE